MSRFDSITAYVKVSVIQWQVQCRVLESCDLMLITACMHTLNLQLLRDVGICAGPHLARAPAPIHS
jgi:hypothetical protein